MAHPYSQDLHGGKVYCVSSGATCREESAGFGFGLAMHRWSAPPRPDHCSYRARQSGKPQRQDRPPGDPQSRRASPVPAALQPRSRPDRADVVQVENPPARSRGAIRRCNMKARRSPPRRLLARRMVQLSRQLPIRIKPIRSPAKPALFSPGICWFIIQPAMEGRAMGEALHGSASMTLATNSEVERHPAVSGRFMVCSRRNVPVILVPPGGPASLTLFCMSRR